jgi:hypothetical protein
VKPIQLFKVAFFFKRCLRLQNFYLTENFLPERKKRENRKMAFYKNAVAVSQKSKRRLIIGPFNFVLKTVNWKTT